MDMELIRELSEDFTEDDGPEKGVGEYNDISRYEPSDIIESDDTDW